MSSTRVHNLHVSIDGYAAGDHVTFDEPIGAAGELFARIDGRVIRGIHRADGPISLEGALTSLWSQGIGVEIMGRRKFGPQTGPWPDDDWVGWWGDEPPFETPVIVLTHHERESIRFDNGTEFHFVDASPTEALALAHELAPGTDVRLGGGPSTVNQFLAADLVDSMHLVVVPIVLGGGTSPWTGLADLHRRFDIEAIGSTDGLSHQLWNRRRE